MSAMSNYFEEALLESLLNQVAFPTLTSIWVGLALNTAFTDLSYASEASGDGYARQETTGGSAWTVADAGSGQWQGKNANAISFPEATGDYSNPVVGWGLFDAATVGNLLVHSTCTSKTVVSGNVVYIEAEELVVEAQ